MKFKPIKNIKKIKADSIQKNIKKIKEKFAQDTIKNNVSDYFKKSFLFDLKAGFITAIVALPLAIAFAIASGVPPIMGLYTAIIAGILGSTLGGSRFSITGPTGAMAVIILSSVSKYGIEGLLVAGFLAGIMQIGFGLLKLGKFVTYIPLPVVSGFTAGIGAIIFIGQIASGLGLNIPAHEHVWETIAEIIKNLVHINPLAVGITVITILLLVFLPKLLQKVKYLENIPASFLALALSTSAVILWQFNVPQVGSIPTGFPTFSFFNINFELVREVLPSAFTIAMLGVIEALLCAVVCDGMTNTKHNANKELIGQGICNITLPFFGGMASTAAIARSAVNIREGAKTRVSGIIHGLFLLSILLLFSPIAQSIPRAFLAGMLMFVSSKMINMREALTIFKISWSETIVLLITFGLTVFTDLVFAVQVGMLFAIFLLFVRLTNIIEITKMEDYQKHEGINALVYKNEQLEQLVNIYTIHGPFFFGAMNVFDKKVNEHMATNKLVTILRMKYVPFIDSTGVVRLNSFIKERKKKGFLLLADITPTVLKTLKKDEEFNELVKYEEIFGKTKEALEYVSKNVHNIVLRQNN
ncbi:SulP family inorganic anion transporter [Candidatus Woesearchaeota archaeon]|nr:SulP family inorganic anion transporter [Candidatus Woesearchaeota archaeon]